MPTNEYIYKHRETIRNVKRVSLRDQESPRSARQKRFLYKRDSPIRSMYKQNCDYRRNDRKYRKREESPVYRRRNTVKRYNCDDRRRPRYEKADSNQNRRIERNDLRDRIGFGSTKRPSVSGHKILIKKRSIFFWKENG